MSKQAEVKIRTFGELSASNVGDNPEPTSEDRGGVESRHGLCLKCGEQIPPEKRSNAKFCSDRCQNAFNSYKHRVKKGDFKKPGVGSGGNQLGTDNHMYKNGIGTFRKRALDYYGAICNRCGTTKDICVHHRDEDRTNNELDNLEVVCKKCHQDHHCRRDFQGRYTSKT